MTEKRFKLDFVGIFDDEKNHYIFDDDLKELVDLLNELVEENEALKKFIKDNFNEMMDSKMVIDDE